MSRKKKVWGITGVVISMLLMTACGNGKASQEDLAAYEGEWVAVAASQEGVSLGMEVIANGDMELVLNSDATPELHFSGGNGEGTWNVNKEEFTLTTGEDEIKGTITEDTLIVEKMPGTDISFTFARKDMIAVAEPGLYLTDAEKTFSGDWIGEKEDVEIEIEENHKIFITYDEQEAEFFWSSEDKKGFVEEGNMMLSWEFTEEGKLHVSYDDGEESCEFDCIRP